MACLSSGWNFGHSSATGFDVNAEFAFFFHSVRVVAYVGVQFLPGTEMGI